MYSNGDFGMSCGTTTTQNTNMRQFLGAMYAKLIADGRPEYATKALFKQRLAQCTHASECGRLCRFLVKLQSIEAVYCNGRTKTNKDAVMLYDALEDPEFECPLGLF